ncbi:MAG: SDR family NAD(P)-dependent oxidoreductase [Bdellovibrionales bacterium]
MKIQEQNFLITGANRGIGLAVAQMAAKERAHLHLISRSPLGSIEEELLNLGAASMTVHLADLSTRDGVEKLIHNLQGHSIDILFNNAGLLTGGLIEEQPLDEIYSMFQVNVNALIHLTRALIPGMVQRGRGKIINNASVSAFMHFPCASTYAASKAAVVAFTDCIQTELHGTGVSTLCLVTPGIKTRMFDEIDTKYSKNFEVPTQSISAKDYADQIRDKIFNDDTYLFPGGTTAMGLWISKYAPLLFRKEIQRRFKRSPR